MKISEVVAYVYNNTNYVYLIKSEDENVAALDLDVWLILLIFVFFLLLPFIIRGLRCLRRYVCRKFQEKVTIAWKRNKKQKQPGGQEIDEKVDIDSIFKEIDSIKDLGKKIERIDRLYKETSLETFFDEGKIFYRKTDLINSLNESAHIRNSLNELLLAGLSALLTTLLAGVFFGIEIYKFGKIEQNILIIVLIALIALIASKVVINHLTESEVVWDQAKKYELDYIKKAIHLHKNDYKRKQLK